MRFPVYTEDSQKDSSSVFSFPPHTANPISPIVPSARALCAQLPQVLRCYRPVLSWSPLWLKAERVLAHPLAAQQNSLMLRQAVH